LYEEAPDFRFVPVKERRLRMSKVALLMTFLVTLGDNEPDTICEGVRFGE